MSKYNTLLSIVFLFFSLLIHSAFAADSHPRSACLVMDYNTGKILYQENPNLQVHPASLTKMMTLYIVFKELQSGQLSLQNRFRVSEHAANQAPSKLGLKPGQYVSVEDLILGATTRSANDAATVLAEGVGKTEANFVAMMNQQAKTLGMKNTVFCNASGLPNPKQYTTAADMALLGNALLKNQKNYYYFFSRPFFHYNGQIIRSHNHLLGISTRWGYDIDGIKTGYVAASGFNIVTSATRDNRRLIGVVFGAPSAKSRDIHMKKLLDHCFEMSQ